jgi:hypothetical protein
MLRAVILLALCVVLVACGGSAQPVPPSVNVQATVDAAVKATGAAQPKATIAPTAIPPTAVPKATTDPRIKTTDCKVGDICAGTDGVVAVAVVEVTRRFNLGNDFIKPQAGYDYIVLNVVLGNGSTKPLVYNPLYAKVRASDGAEYVADLMGMGAFPDSLKTGSLDPQGSVRGILPFQVPTGASGFTLLYQPQTIPQPVSVKIDLGR